MKANLLPRELKEQILSELKSPDAIVNQIARKYKLPSKRLYIWRDKIFAQESSAKFVEVKQIDICQGISLNLGDCTIKIEGKIGRNLLSKILEIGGL